MNLLPPIVSDRLQAVMYDERSVAWLRIDEDLRLVDAGGHLGHYGLSDLCQGKSASQQLYFLEGLLPLTESPMLMPAIQIQNGQAVDLHLHLDDGSVWVLLIDVTAEHDAAQRM